MNPRLQEILDQADRVINDEVHGGSYCGPVLGVVFSL